MFRVGNIPHNKGITKFQNAQELVLARRQYGREWRKNAEVDKEHHKLYRASNIRGHNQPYYEQALNKPWGKRCSMCQCSLPISLFSKSRGMADGFNNHCKECCNKTSKREYANCRYKAIAYYSSGELSCSCCDEKTYEFLCIDHISGGGNKHRADIGLGTGSFYRWLIRNNYPAGYRVLCSNCNCSLGFYGYCPHQGVG